MKIRIGKGLGALNKMQTVWKANLSDNLKRSTWTLVRTLTKTLESKLDGTYTRMLITALNLSWRQHPTKVQLYGNIHPLTTIFREHRMRFVGHCWREKQEHISDNSRGS